jgi:hypothetical protein
MIHHPYLWYHSFPAKEFTRSRGDDMFFDEGVHNYIGCKTSLPNLTLAMVGLLSMKVSLQS